MRNTITTARIHYRTSHKPAASRPACGRPNGATSFLIGRVTCGHCIRFLERRRKALLRAERERIERNRAILASR